PHRPLHSFPTRRSSDLLGRLTEAWTAKTDCEAAPSASTVGGPDAYWHTYGYDKTGNRTTQTEHPTTGGGTGATTTYVHPAPGAEDRKSTRLNSSHVKIS